MWDWDIIPLRVLIPFPLFKGATLAVVTLSLGIDFWKALVIGGVSATIGAVGTVVGALTAARMVKGEAEKTRTAVRDVKRKVGAAHRETDR